MGHLGRGSVTGCTLCPFWYLRQDKGDRRWRIWRESPRRSWSRNLLSPLGDSSMAMPLWLTYSLLLACVVGLGFALWLGGKAGSARFSRISRYAGYLQISAVVAAYLVLRPGAGDPGTRDIAAASAASQPIFIDLYSNF